METFQVFNKQKISKARNKHNVSLTKTVMISFFIIGAFALFTSIIYVSSILVFVGLGLVFWGAILTYIKPEPYTRKAILDATVISSLSTLHQIIKELNYEGKAIYLPQKYFTDPETCKIYIPKEKLGKIPIPEIFIKNENNFFFDNPQGVLLMPPGAHLSRLFEKKLDTRFNNVDLNYFAKNLVKLFIDDFELAENLEIEMENNKIKTIITNSSFREVHNEYNRLSHLHVNPSIGCPISSAIACALTKVTGKPITIENIRQSEDGRNIETTYQILGNIENDIHSQKIKITEQPIELITETVQLLTSKRSLPYLVSILLTTIGALIFALVAWLTFYDMTLWGKDVVQILFDPRTGESISLGIGMQLIHYIIIGLIALTSGIVTYFQRRLP